MKTETPLSIIMRNQKPSLLARFGRFIATPFVGIYNSIKSCTECKQEIPANFANSKLVTFYTRGEVLQGGDLYKRDNDNLLVEDRGSIQTKPRSDEKSEGKTSNELKKEEKIDTPSLTVPVLSKREKSGFFQTFKRLVTKFFSARAKESATVYHSALGNGDCVSFDTEIGYPPLNGQPLSAQPFQERMLTPPTSHEEATLGRGNTSWLYPESWRKSVGTREERAKQPQDQEQQRS